jgi:hypothetical protein
MLRPTILLKVGVAALVVFLAVGAEAMGQFSDSQRRSTGNKNPNPPRRSPGNFPPDQPNYYSTYNRQSSSSQGQSSGGATVVVPNP